MIKTITFDFGGVLYDYDGEGLLADLASRSEKNPGELRELLDGSELDRAHFRGEVEAKELLNILKEEIGLRMTEKELARAYADNVSPKEEVFDLVHDLEGGYNLQLYSDAPKILYDEVMTDMPVFDSFSAVTLSFRVGKLKDEPDGHREVIEKSGHAPEEIIFIDDREEFVQQANKLGINGIKFTEIDELIKDLDRLGVNPDGKFDLNIEEG
ncbi:MAG: HAD family hydrolase [Candidatus Acetothermia bacterium]